MKKNCQKLICYVLSTCVISSITLTSPSKVYASDLNSKTTKTISKQKDKEVLTGINLNKVKTNGNHTITKKVFTSEEIAKIQSEIKVAKANNQKGMLYTVSAFPLAIVATYEIPGIGEVALAATGVIIVGGVVFAAGSYIYNEVMDWMASSDDTVDVSDSDNWEEKDLDDVLDDVNGERGNTKKGWDGTIKVDVNDVDTGDKIGEIHMKQPEYDDNNKYTGKKYPTHYHDWDNRLGEGSDYHWYWE